MPNVDFALLSPARPKVETVRVKRMCQCPSCGHRFTEDSTDDPPLPFSPGKPEGSITLMTRVKQILNQRSKIKNADGTWRYNFRFDDVAEQFVRALESGDFNFMREFLNRLEGRVAQRLANADGSNLKMYENMPTDGTEAP